MAGIQVNDSLPTNVPNLIDRIECLPPEHEERRILDFLCRAVVQELDSEQILKSAWEVTRLSEVLLVEEYISLLRKFANTIASGTSDHSSLDPALLACIVCIIRQGEGKLTNDNNPLASLFESLIARLENSKNHGNPQLQYDLICALSVALEAMADVHVSGLSRESLHSRLLTLLETFIKDETEIHIVQAACYAAQVLQDIPNDETEFEKVLRRTLRVADVAALTAAGGLAKDPQKLYQACVQAFKIGSDLKDNIWRHIRSHTSKSWHKALRVTEILIQNESFGELEDYINNAECRTKKEFLCGLYAQLEQAQHTSNKAGYRQVYTKIPSGDSARVQAWVQFSAPSSVRSHSTRTAGKHHVPLRPRGRRTYESNVKPFLWRQQSKEQEDIATSGSLVQKACKSSLEVRRFYVRNALRGHYTTHDRLQIHRLSGQVLPMDQCFINLTITKGSDGQAIPLPQLFQPRRLSNGTTSSPQRIFIKGQAGVGKTTLCKKIVHDFLYKNSWSDRFDWLLWLPLRSLKQRPSTSYSMKRFFKDHYLAQHSESDREVLADTLCEEVNKQSGHCRALFILDGLDEVAHDWDADTPMGEFLRRLVQRAQHAIVTSRQYYPSLLGLKAFDLELKTVGFHREQIESYVSAPGVIPDPEKAKRIMSFIRAQSLIREIASIPIQLDALCFTWGEQTNYIKNMSQTMTAIYQSIVLSLLRKDIRKLGKCCNQKVLTEPMVAGMSALEVEETMRQELNLLEGLAFQGFYNRIIEFDRPMRDKIHRLLRSSGDNLPAAYNSVLKDLSFLRTSDTNMESEKQSFHFLHLTFQEYFAARYLVSHWIRGTKMTVLALHHGSTSDELVSPQTVLAREKYNLRWNMLWKYVAGLLDSYRQQANDGERCLVDFFHQLEAGPRDMMGPTHQLLTMDCLNEVPAMQDSPRLSAYRLRSEKQLSWWAEFEFWALFQAQSKLPDSIVNVLVRCLSTTDDLRNQGIARVIGKQPGLGPEVVRQLSQLLKNPESRRASAFALSLRSDLPPQILQDMMGYSRDADSLVRQEAAMSLSSQKSLPSEALDALVLKLQDTQSGLLSVRVLLSQAVVPTRATLPILKWFDNAHFKDRVLITEPLDTLQIASSQIVNSLNSDVRFEVTEAVGKLANTSPRLRDVLVELSSDKSEKVRSSTVPKLGSLSNPSNNVVTAVVKRLDDGDYRSRREAVISLSKFTSSDQALSGLYRCLDDPSRLVRETAVYALDRLLTASGGLWRAQEHAELCPQKCLTSSSSVLQAQTSRQFTKSGNSYIPRKSSTAFFQLSIGNPSVSSIWCVSFWRLVTDLPFISKGEGSSWRRKGLEWRFPFRRYTTGFGSGYSCSVLG
ncbi:hypothetical protein P170DRAFT_402202 [Aspergillus steynii IBT 23096]|uniref:NACHT domain-containing protein n=1 Tax=Aspergillus steynii IBT 23096 TaxID=1392250 RepID=A0A2I2GH64_9EURO|nr:uncharacterized protein P170DRAFT_402202 [Aspergillus steynii IBT 23096]PLB52218.1 hypothetical protein P170DRAFT_402202 [Aspergillus steynii IBT 23096]